MINLQSLNQNNLYLVIDLLTGKRFFKFPVDLKKYNGHVNYRIRTDIYC
jgi:hypothetical protein